MKNGKHTIIRLIRLIRLTRLILGQKNKRLTEREVWLTLKMGVSSVSGVSGVSGVPHQREFPNQVCSTAKC